MVGFLELDELRQAWPFIRNAAWMGIVIGGVCPLVGVYFVLRRMVFIGVAIPQVSAAGISFAFLSQSLGWFGLVPAASPHLGFALTGAILFTVAAILAMGMLLPRSGGLGEAFIGLIFVVAGGLSLLLLSQAPVAEASLLNLLKGELVAVTLLDLVRAIVFFGIIGAVLYTFHKEFLLTAFDRDLAVTMGKSVRAWDFLFLVVAGLTVSVAVFNVGPLAGFGYLVIPPLIALLFSRNMLTLFAVSSAVGILASLLSFYLSFRFDWPMSPASVTLLGVLYAFLGLGRLLFAACFRRSVGTG